MLLEKSGPLNKGILFIEIEESENKLKREKKERKKRGIQNLNPFDYLSFSFFFPPLSFIFSPFFFIK